MFDRKGLRLMEFPPIYILSLEGAQRFGPLVEALAARGLSYEIFWGIDGRERLPDKHEPRVDRAGAEARMGRPMSDGEFACALSHRGIYERIAAGDAPSAIVLEDDADPSLPFFDLGPALVEPPCGLLLFDHKNTYVRVRDRLILPGGVQAYRVALPPFLATGYMVSREVAAHLAFRNGPVVQPSDWPDAILQFDSYACDPRVITQRGRTVASLLLGASCFSAKHAPRQTWACWRRRRGCFWCWALAWAR